MTPKTWENVKFSDIASFKYGKMPTKNKILETGGYPIYSGYRYVGYYNEYNIDKNTLIIIARGVGGTGDVKLTKEKCYLTNLSIAVFPFNNNSVNTLYLYYYFLLHNLRYLDSGSAQSQITISDLEKLVIKLPPLETQKKIAVVLSSLDDKIELNNKINQNLEQQADLLFNDLFLEDKDCIKLSEVISTTSGGTPSRKNLNFYTNGSFCWVKSKELNGTFITETEEKINQLAIEKSSAKLLPPYSVLLAMYGATVGEYAIISKQMTCNQAICAIIPNEKYPYTYIYEYIKLSKERIKTLAIGSAQQNISQVLIKDLLVHKNINKIKEYHFKTRYLFELIKNNQIENEKLKQLRDTLLPKLLSGEIDVDKVEV